MLGPSKTRTILHSDTHPDWVVLLDGIGPNCFTVGWMAKPLASEGFSVLEIRYPSTRWVIDKLARRHVGPILSTAIPPEARTIHFVTLSMGGIVLRRLLQTKWRPEKLGRTVMLAPPNQGSEVSDFLKPMWFYRWSLGPAGQELTTDAASVPNSLGPVDFPCGVIAGTHCYDPWFGWLFKGPNDGKVSVESAKVAGMSDFLTLPHSHYDIMLHARTHFEVVHFLRNGCFSASNENSP